MVRVSASFGDIDARGESCVGANTVRAKGFYVRLAFSTHMLDSTRMIDFIGERNVLQTGTQAPIRLFRGGSGAMTLRTSKSCSLQRNRPD